MPQPRPVSPSMIHPPRVGAQGGPRERLGGGHGLGPRPAAPPRRPRLGPHGGPQVPHLRLLYAYLHLSGLCPHGGSEVPPHLRLLFACFTPDWTLSTRISFPSHRAA
jgi:hypothetical protein